MSLARTFPSNYLKNPLFYYKTIFKRTIYTQKSYFPLPIKNPQKLTHTILVKLNYMLSLSHYSMKICVSYKITNN